MLYIILEVRWLIGVRHSAVLKVTSAEISKRRWSQPLWIRRKISVGIKYGLLPQYYLSAIRVWQGWNWEMSMRSWNGRRGLPPTRVEAAPTGLPEMVLLMPHLFLLFSHATWLVLPFSLQTLLAWTINYVVTLFPAYTCSHLELSWRPRSLNYQGFPNVMQSMKSPKTLGSSKIFVYNSENIYINSIIKI